MGLLFGVKADEIKAKCDKVADEKTRSANIEKSFQELSKAKKSKNPLKASDYTLEKNIIKAALPCATEEQVNKKLAIYTRQ